MKLCHKWRVFANESPSPTIYSTLSPQLARFLPNPRILSHFFFQKLVRVYSNCSSVCTGSIVQVLDVLDAHRMRIAALTYNGAAWQRRQSGTVNLRYRAWILPLRLYRSAPAPLALRLIDVNRSLNNAGAGGGTPWALPNIYRKSQLSCCNR